MPPTKTPSGLELRVRAYEKQCLIEALTNARGNIRHAALAIDTRRSHIYRLMRRYGLKLEDFRADTR